MSHPAESYRFDHDPGIFDKDLVAFLERFYVASDIRGSAAEWVACFAEDGDLQKGSVTAKGPQELLALSQASFEGQVSRKHTISKAYAASSQSPDEIMVLGRTETQRTEVSRVSTLWAATLSLDRHASGKIAIKSYNIFPGVTVPA